MTFFSFSLSISLSCCFSFSCLFHFSFHFFFCLLISLFLSSFLLTVFSICLSNLPIFLPFLFCAFMPSFLLSCILSYLPPSLSFPLRFLHLRGGWVCFMAYKPFVGYSMPTPIYIYIYIRRTIHLMKENGFILEKARNRRYPSQTITDAD